MNRKLRKLILAGAMALPLMALAQEDDMYFTARKNKKKAAEQTVQPEQPVRQQTWVVTYEDGEAQSGNEQVRDVDEYNRRYVRRDNDTLYLDDVEGNSGVPMNADEDADYGSRLMRERTLLLGIPVGSRLYWDLCYGPASFYWNVYDDGFYAYAYLWSWTYAYGYPWWGGYPGWGWGRPWGWGSLSWGWGPDWYPGGHWHRPGWGWGRPLRGASVYHGVRNGHRGAWYPSRGTATATGSGRYNGRPAGTSRPGMSAGGRTPSTSRPSRSGIGRTYGTGTNNTPRPSTGSQRPQRHTDVQMRPSSVQRQPSSVGGSRGGAVGGGSRGGYGGGRRR
ncbi:MAG: hypothetical protein NC388_03855 [Clostridium sp.]|nr:hypothetical protein [Clostridium sp.]